MKRIKGLVLVLVLMLVAPINTKAASTYISADGTVVNGNNITATVTLKDVAAWDIKISGSGSTNGCSTHEVGDSGTGNNTTKYFSVTCKANSLGTITFSYSGDVTSSDGNNTKVSGSKKVTVVKPREKSTNNNLKSLSVEGYELTPEFSKDTLEYNVEVTDDKETIKINAEKEDGYASLEGDGEIEVAEGVNKLEVKVTSETGVEKVYVLNVNVKDNNPITEKVNGESFTLVKRSKSLVLPEGLDSEKFVPTTIKIGENEIPALVSEELKLTLVGLKDKSGVVYLYEVVNGKIKDRYELLTTKGLTVKFKEPKEIIDGYTKTTIKIGDKEYTAYQNKYKDYALIYGTNTETNEDNWYLYNIKEKSIQKYAKDMIDDINKEYNDKINTYTLIIIGLSSIAVLLLIIVIILAITKNKNKKPKDKNKNQIEDIKEDTLVDKLEDTKEIDASEIIINKIEEPKLEEVVKIEETKKDKKKNKELNQPKENNSEFLNTEDLKEILENQEVKEEIKKESRKEKKKKKKKGAIEDSEMARDFLE